MFVELVALVTGVIVLLACVSGQWVATRNRTEDVFADEAPTRPFIGAVTSQALADLPLVAPERAGYGTSSRLLIQAAQARTRVDRRNWLEPAPAGAHAEDRAA